MTRDPEDVRPTVPWGALLASASDVILIVDDAQRIVLFNGAAERLFECPAADAIGAPVDRFLPLPDARATGRHAVLARRADGTGFPVEAEISRVTVDGRPLYAAVVRDVGGRRRAEEAPGRLAALVASSDDAIVAKDLDGIVTDWNPAAERIFGYTAAEMIGRSILTLLPPERRHEEHDILATLRRGERIDHFDTVRVRKDGTLVDVSISVSPIKNAAGAIVGAAKIARDVTERKRLDAERERLLASERAARAEAETANRAKDEFLSMVSHELRTPLAAILGWVGVLRQGKLSPERTARALETIERSGRLQAELIDDLLDVSRMVSGRLRLTLRPTNLRAVLQSAVEAVRPDALAAGIRLSATLDGDARVEGDQTRLQQVLSNVLGNAIKFTPPDGRIDVRLERSGEEARIVVCDTGRGIAADFLLHVFEPFRQADDVKSRKSGGLGLGLAIVRHLVEQHRGRVSVESPGPGLGTTVTIVLPVAPHAVPAPDPAGASPRLDGVRVLVVDDDEAMREMLRAALEERGALVSMAASTADARAQLMCSTHDVLVSDIRLPGEDGYALVREVRRTDRLRSVPAVAITAYDREEVPARALEAGFHAHLGKPFDPDTLVGTIAALADRRLEPS